MAKVQFICSIQVAKVDYVVSELSSLAVYVDEKTQLIAKSPSHLVSKTQICNQFFEDHITYCDSFPIC